MNQQSTVELLESTHQFPCSYVFKAIGRDEKSFVARVVAAVRQQTQSECDPPYRLRNSAGGQHVAVTMEVPVESPAQVLAVYERLRSIEGLTVLW